MPSRKKKIVNRGEYKEVKGYLGVLSAVVIVLAILSIIVINLTGFSIFDIGIEYIVLKRIPADKLPERSSSKIKEKFTLF